MTGRDASSGILYLPLIANAHSQVGLASLSKMITIKPYCSTTYGRHNERVFEGSTAIGLIWSFAILKSLCLKSLVKISRLDLTTEQRFRIFSELFRFFPSQFFISVLFEPISLRRHLPAFI